MLGLPTIKMKKINLDFYGPLFRTEINQQMQTHTPGKLKVLSVEIHWFCFYNSLDRKLDLLIGKIAGVSPGESKLKRQN